MASDDGDDGDDGVAIFESVRPRSFGIAYHMPGSAAEAEDIAQDAWLLWQGISCAVCAEHLAAFPATHINSSEKCLAFSIPGVQR